MNRHQKRAKKHDLNRAGYTAQVNGVSHASLTGRAFDHLRAALVSHGNKLSEPHEAALYALCGLFTASAQETRPGRYAFGLPTGMGKTTAVVAWCRALVELRLDHIAVSVSASKIEALCQIKRDLIAAGVPEARIGLLYAGGGRYSEPCTADNDDRQIMLVSHARVRSGVGLKRFNSYRGGRRALTIYDESLIAADAKGVSMRELRAAVASLSVLINGREGADALLTYLEDALVLIRGAIEAAKANPTPQIVRLGQIADAELATHRSLIPRRGSMAPVVALMDLAQEDLRVVSTSEGGAVWYEVAVPRELRNVLVLDASYPIRDLCRADETILDAERWLPELQRLGTDADGRKLTLSGLKSYEDVELRQLFVRGGRDAMERDFSKDPWDRRVTREIVDVIKAVPTDQSILVFVFKGRPGSPDFAGITLSALQQAGIDTRATVAMMDKGKLVQKDRINVVTWGMETSLNSYSHCANVILAGVLHRSTLDLAGTYLGQRDDLRAGVTGDTIKRLVNSEVCHCIYQAMSRGTCRVIADGKALPMKGWVIHRDIGIQPVLSSVMPGVRWAEWLPNHGSQCGHLTAKTAAAIETYLRSLPEEVAKVSTRKLKADAGLSSVREDTMSEALNLACKEAPWMRSGRSVARLPTSPT